MQGQGKQYQEALKKKNNSGWQPQAETERTELGAKAEERRARLGVIKQEPEDTITTEEKKFFLKDKKQEEIIKKKNKPTKEEDDTNGERKKNEAEDNGESMKNKFKTMKPKDRKEEKKDNAIKDNHTTGKHQASVGGPHIKNPAMGSPSSTTFH